MVLSTKRQGIPSEMHGEHALVGQPRGFASLANVKAQEGAEMAKMRRGYSARPIQCGRGGCNAVLPSHEDQDAHNMTDHL